MSFILIAACENGNDPSYGFQPQPGGSAGSTGLSDSAAGAKSSASAGSASVGGAQGFSGSAGRSNSAGASGVAGSAAEIPFSTTCDDIGVEPTIPEACATVAAQKHLRDGVVSDEARLDTIRIQEAITACPAGQAVKLSVDGDESLFVSGPLFLRNGVTLWVDKGVTLFPSRNPRDFDTKPGVCGTGTGGSSACFALINANGVTGAGVMGEGLIDGRGDEPVIGQDPPTTYWQLNDSKHFDGDLAAPRLVQTSVGKDFTLYKITLRDPPKFNVVIGTNGFVVWGISIIADKNSPNTDGVDPTGASNGVIAYSKISTGDDNIAIKASGTPVDNIVVAHNHFGEGHGMSIGSETFGGVKNVRVCDLSLDRTDNGLRIKSDLSRGGLVQNVSFTDVCMRQVKHPLVFDPFYSTATGNRIPQFRNIILKNVHVLGGGISTIRGYDATHPLTMALDNVVLDDAASATFKSQHAMLTYGPGPVNFMPAGVNVNVTSKVEGDAAPRDCTDAWVPFDL